MQATTMVTFLVIAEAKTPLLMSDLAKLTGTAQSSTSRNVSSLSKVNRHNREGHGLVKTYEDPTNLRRKFVELTSKGRRYKELLEAICR